MKYNNSPIKWVGGKGRLLNTILPLIPKDINNYFEPFVGGGSVFFALKPKDAYLNDMNDELINFYEVLQNNVEDIITTINSFPLGETEYYEIRNLDRDKNWKYNLGNIKRAARFVYLNRMCFNGLWRVNSKGYNNTPYGKVKNPNFQFDRLKGASATLKNNNVILQHSDFEIACAKIQKGDFTYLDSPYIPLSEKEAFVNYTTGGFGWSDHLRLKNLCDELSSKDIKFMLSNSSSPLALDLYKNYNIINTQIKRLVGGKGSNRKEVNEIIVMNY
jgi:DNA adenine methylase